jgi:hypothetical protein
MTQIFISRAELMPEGETTQEHAETKLMEASIVETDKSNTDYRTGGLFRGCFRSASTWFREPIRDFNDGVLRCPTCTYEMVGHRCTHCGETLSDSDVDSIGDGESIISEDFTEEDDMTVSEDIAVHPRHIYDMDGYPAHMGYMDHDDISLDGDGHGVHTPTEYGTSSIGRRAAQDLTRRDYSRFPGIPGYAPSNLSTVDGFSEIDEDNEEDDDSLEGFIEPDYPDNDTLEDRRLQWDEDLATLRRIRGAASDSPSLDSTEPESETTTHITIVDDHSTDIDGAESELSLSPNRRRRVLSNASSHGTLSDGPDVSSDSTQSTAECEAEVQSMLRAVQSRKRRRTVLDEDDSEDDGLDIESERSSQRRRLSRNGSSETVNPQEPSSRPGSSRQLSPPSRTLLSTTDDDEEDDDDDEPRSLQSRRRQQKGLSRARPSHTQRRTGNRNPRDRATTPNRSANPDSLSSPNNTNLRNNGSSSRASRNLVPNPLTIRDHPIPHGTRLSNGQRQGRRLPTGGYLPALFHLAGLP